MMFPVFGASLLAANTMFAIPGWALKLVRLDQRFLSISFKGLIYWQRLYFQASNFLRLDNFKAALTESEKLSCKLRRLLHFSSFSIVGKGADMSGSLLSSTRSSFGPRCVPPGAGRISSIAKMQWKFMAPNIAAVPGKYFVCRYANCVTQLFTESHCLLTSVAVVLH